MSKFWGKLGESMMSNPVGWGLAGLSVINYISGRRKQQRMRERLAPIAAEQMKQIREERTDITQEYKGMADTAVAQGDIAMASLALNRQSRFDKAQANIGGTNLAFGSGNLAGDNLLSAFNQQMSQRSMQTTAQVVGIQNRLAGELRSLDASALNLKSQYAQQGVGVNYNMTNIDQYKYV
tara:strand:- start:254 stop:793 length:540 start_codon:yes stop_codon:yes gene_type:complete